MTDWHPDDDALVDLVLQAPEPDERARLSSHLAACDACRGRYAELADGAQQVLLAAPSIAPPPGFSGRVLQGMQLGESPAPVVPLRRTGWTRLASVAAALLVGLGLGIGGTIVVHDRQQPVAVNPSVVRSAAALVTADGTSVGTVGLTTMSGRQVLVVTVTRAKPGKSYDCVVVGGDGRRRTVGSWTLTSTYGSETAAGTWAVDVPAGGVRGVELVTSEGRVWSEAAF
jgi:anti-sigma factor RsiW